MCTHTHILPYIIIRQTGYKYGNNSYNHFTHSSINSCTLHVYVRTLYSRGGGDILRSLVFEYQSIVSHLYNKLIPVGSWYTGRGSKTFWYVFLLVQCGYVKGTAQPPHAEYNDWSSHFAWEGPHPTLYPLHWAALVVYYCMVLLCDRVPVGLISIIMITIEGKSKHYIYSYWGPTTLLLYARKQWAIEICYWQIPHFVCSIFIPRAFPSGFSILLY